MRDRIHQPYRASFVPGLDELIALDGPDVYGIALSGAGPSVIALVRHGATPIAAQMTAVFARHAVAARSFELALATHGLLATPL